MWFYPQKKKKKNWAKYIKGFDNFREFMGISIILKVLLCIFVILGGGGVILVMWGCLGQFRNFKYFFLIINFDAFFLFFFFYQKKKLMIFWFCLFQREREREREIKGRVCMDGAGGLFNPTWSYWVERFSFLNPIKSL